MKETFNIQHLTFNIDLTVAIIARDEERHIGEAIRSVQGLASEVLVLLDSRSQDATEAISRSLSARVEIEPWQNFSAQRNIALARCHTEWLLFLDADERLTPELYAEIGRVLGEQGNRRTGEQANRRTGEDEPQATSHKTRDTSLEPGYKTQNSKLKTQNPVQTQIIASLRKTQSILHPSKIVGYWIPRHNMFFGKLVRGGGWYPDHQLRLLRCGYAYYDETRLVHELAVLDGQAAYLNEHLLHLNIEHIDELWRKQRSYAIQEAQIMLLEGKSARWRNLLGAPLREFYRRFVQLSGWRDGRVGLLLCATLAFFEFVKYARVLGLQAMLNAKC